MAIIKLNCTWRFPCGHLRNTMNRIRTNTRFTIHAHAYPSPEFLVNSIVRLGCSFLSVLFNFISGMIKETALSLCEDSAQNRKGWQSMSVVSISQPSEWQWDYVAYENCTFKIRNTVTGPYWPKDLPCSWMRWAEKKLDKLSFGQSYLSRSLWIEWSIFSPLLISFLRFYETYEEGVLSGFYVQIAQYGREQFCRLSPLSQAIYGRGGSRSWKANFTRGFRCTLVVVFCLLLYKHLVNPLFR